MLLIHAQAQEATFYSSTLANELYGNWCVGLGVGIKKILCKLRLFDVRSVLFGSGCECTSLEYVASHVLISFNLRCNKVDGLLSKLLW